MRPKVSPAILLLVLAMAALAAAAKEAAVEEEQDPWFTFLPGRYVLVGRGQGGGAAYAGEAAIATSGQVFQLVRTVGGKTIAAEGKIEVPSPPGEGKVLRFRWTEGGSRRTMTCLVSSDLDNYGRLSCLWASSEGGLKSPGLEAYFSRETWSAD